jgi:hypothetical protein
MSALDVVQKYLPPEMTPPRPRGRVPASARLLEAITEIEKADRAKGQYWLAMAFEFAAWVRIKHEEKLRAEGRLCDPKEKT